MKLIHIADLHFGKQVHGYSMITNQDQVDWTNQFLDLVKKEKIDVVLIAGDVYDRSIAPKEAIQLFDYFITSLAKLDIEVCIVAGNHDSGVRLASMSQILKQHKIHIAGEVKKQIEKIELYDEYGTVNIYLVPYVFPAAVEQVIPGKYKDYHEAMNALLQAQNIDYTKRNIIVSHQLVTYMGNEPEKGGSEEMVGGIGGIDVSLYEPFDYAALGHIHAAQKVKYDHIRYAGSNLCYHFEELKKPKKGPIIIDLKEKGNITITPHYIKPLHSLRLVEGTLEEIIKQEKNITERNQYIKVILKDDYIPINALNTLEALYNDKNSTLMALEHLPKRILSHRIENTIKSEQLSLHDSFVEFYKEKNNGEYPDELDSDIIKYICTQIESSEDTKIDQDDITSLIDFIISKEELS